MPLMTYDEYRDARHEIPYTYILKSGSGFLYFFGEGHSYDPGDSQWARVKDFWKSFLADTEGKRRIVFIEGGTIAHEADEKKAILENGGMGLVTHLAHKENIEVHSPEPDDAYERQELQKEFSREEIQYYYFARLAHQWGKTPEPKMNFEEYINRYLERDKQKSGWSDFDFSVEAMKKIHHKLFHSEFSENDADFIYTIVNPIDQGTVINNVSRRSSEVRDIYIVEQIKKYMANGYSIFAHFGATHAVIQEPLLREVLGANNV